MTFSRTSYPALLAAASFGAALGFLLGGRVLVGVVLLVVAAALVLPHLARPGTLRATAPARARELAGFGSEAVRVWARTRGDAARLRLEERRLDRERSRLQSDLGAAAFADDTEGCADLIGRMRELDDRRAARAAETARAVEAARAKLERERLAIQPTEIRE